MAVINKAFNPQLNKVSSHPRTIPSELKTKREAQRKIEFIHELRAQGLEQAEIDEALKFQFY
ncbi:hypothetical protein [Shewanella vaxholmensis]|uniref:Uncharacterized protein n=1 Tax=Shewanella vaxholmensis TaxID=3063535 RepID=A0ABU9UWP2_9GAMM